MIRTYIIKELGAVVTVDTEKKSGEIESTLHEKNPDKSRPVDKYNAAMDAIEALILAMACAGFDVGEKKFVQCVQTAIEGCENSLLN